jgi:hypothetical protein
MIANCQHCHVCYWRFRRDHPPAGFCSCPCAELGPTRKQGPAPDLPEEILRAMRWHRLEAHDSTSALTWHDCERCEELEEAYAESLLYHVSRISTEIADEAKRLHLGIGGAS